MSAQREKALKITVARSPASIYFLLSSDITIIFVVSLFIFVIYLFIVLCFA